MHRAETWRQALVLGLALAGAGAVPAAANVETCRPLEGAERWLRSGVVVLLGEIHGTEEAPLALESWVCLAIARGLPTTVALEVPRSEQERLDRYLASAGDAAARADLLSGAFWRRAYQDGRSSRAMADLLERLRLRARGGADLRVTALDIEGESGRDTAMAARLADDLRRDPRRFTVALAGNWHTRLVAGAPWDGGYRPFGLQLRELAADAEIVSFDLAHTGGTAWLCFSASESDCAVRHLRGEGRAGAAIELADGAEPAAYSGRQNIGELHASLPALKP